MSFREYGEYDPGLPAFDSALIRTYGVRSLPNPNIDVPSGSNVKFKRLIANLGLLAVMTGILAPPSSSLSYRHVEAGCELTTPAYLSGDSEPFTAWGLATEIAAHTRQDPRFVLGDLYDLGSPHDGNLSPEVTYLEAGITVVKIPEQDCGIVGREYPSDTRPPDHVNDPQFWSYYP